MATVHPQLRPPPPPIDQPQYTHPTVPHTDIVADNYKTESVAESYPLGMVIDAAANDDDDGCSSCVEGDEWHHDQELQEDEGEEDDGDGEEEDVWRKQIAAEGVLRMEEDPKRQEEDKKFWEACLASGYP